MVSSHDVSRRDVIKMSVGAAALIAGCALVPDAAFAATTSSAGKTRYVNLYQAKFYTQPKSSSSFIWLPYMTPVTLVSTTGNYTKVLFNGTAYYLYNAASKLTATKAKRKDYATANAQRNAVVNFALNLQQNSPVKYKKAGFGETDANGKMRFDCSGFVAYVMRSVMRKYYPTFRISSNITQLANSGNLLNPGAPDGYRIDAKKVTLKQAQPGDIVLFYSWDNEKEKVSASKKIVHSGIYLGSNRFINCTTHTRFATGNDTDLYIEPLGGGYWKERTAYFLRIIPDSKIPSLAETRYAMSQPTATYKAEGKNDRQTALEDGWVKDTAKLAKNQKVTVICKDPNSKWAWASYVEGGKTKKALLDLNYLSLLAAPGKPTLSSPSKGCLNATWDAVSGAEGYQLRLAATSTFTGARVIDVPSGTQNTALVEGLDAKRTFCAVRAYRSVEGSTVYSAWSLYNSRCVK